MVSYVAAFRTYEWNESIEILADRFFGNCASARKVVLADETRGALPIPDRFEKVSHTDDTAAFGLLNTPRPQGNSLWFNVDYGAIILGQKLPDYDYYLLSESDLAVNLDLEFIVETAARDGIDFIARDIRPAESTWFWFENGRASFAEVWRSLLFFMVFSKRALRAITRGRQILTSRAQDDPGLNWPFCEVFVPACLMENGMKLAPLEDFAETSHLNYRPRLSLANPVASAPGSLVHSVLGSDSFTSAVIAEFGPRYFFEQDPAKADLRWEDRDTVRTRFLDAFLARGDHAGYTRLMKTVAVPSRRRRTEEVSIRKPAATSSTSPYSRHRDVTLDACGANGDAVPEEYGFHTEEEHDPWWAVDLVDECLIERITIVNRRDWHERFRMFAIESSRDGATWIVRYTKFDAADVSSDVDHPGTFPFPDPFLCRFVRIRMLGRGILHLRRISVYGVVVFETNDQSAVLAGISS